MAKPGSKNLNLNLDEMDVLARSLRKDSGEFGSKVSRLRSDLADTSGAEKAWASMGELAFMQQGKEARQSARDLLDTVTLDLETMGRIVEIAMRNYRSEDTDSGAEIAGVKPETTTDGHQEGGTPWAI